MKKVLNMLIIGLGIFMVINAVLVFYRFSSGQTWELSSFEKVFSSCVTASVGVLLLLQTYRLIKEKGKNTEVR